MTRPAIIVAHGQPSDPGPQQKAIETLAASVAEISGRRVIGATLAMPGALESAVSSADAALVYPMFMAEGWFTGTELPRRLKKAGADSVLILRPFGVDPGLAAMCTGQIARKAAAMGWPAAGTTVLLIAHGSQRARGSARGTEAMAARLRGSFGRVVAGFIEEAPFLADAARDLGPRAIALPFFATRAEHVTDDIPQALKESGFAGPCLPPVGLAAEVPAMIAAALDRQDAAIAPAPPGA